MSFARVVLVSLGTLLVACGLTSGVAHAQPAAAAALSAQEAALHPVALASLFDAGQPLEAATLAALPADQPFECDHFFGQDLREARKPRLRSERPSKQVLENDSTTASLLAEVDLDRSESHFLAGSLDLAALPGHPSELLRPPSLTA